MNLSGMYDACKGSELTSAILKAVLCRMFPFSLREGREIVLQSPKMGACPPPRLKHFYWERLFLVHCFCRQYFTSSRKVIWVILRLFSVLQLYRSISKEWAKNVVVTTISSGRMSSQHILREDELEDHSWFSLLLGYLATISSWRMGSLNILREDELENYSWFSLLPWYLAIISSGRMSSLHAHMDDELENYSWFSLLLC